MRIANFSKRTVVATAAVARAQCDDAPRYSLVERVCSFMERYPLTHAEENVASSASKGGAVLCRTEDDRRRRKV
ncbi:MAG TPA: hypothetical protein VGG18_12675 [Granulicella sp.]|jgi:hypothetical protein